MSSRGEVCYLDDKKTTSFTELDHSAFRWTIPLTKFVDQNAGAVTEQESDQGRVPVGACVVQGRGSIEVLLVDVGVVFVQLVVNQSI